MRDWRIPGTRDKNNEEVAGFHPHEEFDSQRKRRNPADYQFCRR